MNWFLCHFYNQTSIHKHKPSNNFIKKKVPISKFKFSFYNHRLWKRIIELIVWIFICSYKKHAKKFASRILVLKPRVLDSLTNQPPPPHFPHFSSCNLSFSFSIRHGISQCHILILFGRFWTQIINDETEKQYEEFQWSSRQPFRSVSSIRCIQS